MLDRGICINEDNKAVQMQKSSEHVQFYPYIIVADEFHFPCVNETIVVTVDLGLNSQYPEKCT